MAKVIVNVSSGAHERNGPVDIMLTQLDWAL
jgi:hypothetical protein